MIGEVAELKELKDFVFKLHNSFTIVSPFMFGEMKGMEELNDFVLRFLHFLQLRYLIHLFRG